MGDNPKLNMVCKVDLIKTDKIKNISCPFNECSELLSREQLKEHSELHKQIELVVEAEENLKYMDTVLDETGTGTPCGKEENAPLLVATSTKFLNSTFKPELTNWLGRWPVLHL